MKENAGNLKQSKKQTSPLTKLGKVFHKLKWLLTPENDQFPGNTLKLITIYFKKLTATHSKKIT